ncbi:hypothetical protein [Nocardioides kongjuensis]|uniref:hypothetical protein n=1 Tax=Nocardioides kongjuensis TaxID=349522 RepID=UPI0031E9BB14
MSDHSVDDVAHVYAYIHDQGPPRGLPLLSGDHPLGLLQTYDPAVDEIGRWYDRAPATSASTSSWPTTRAAPAAPARSSPRARPRRPPARLPPARVRADSRNTASVSLLERLGCVRGPLVEMRTSVAEEAGAVLLLDRERALVLARR